MSKEDTPSHKTAIDATRLTQRLDKLRDEGRGALVTFLTAGDPDPVLSQTIINGLPEAGADIIEIGMPFSDPMADGPVIQAANKRALDAGMTLEKTLEMVRAFREHDTTTPVVLMGYFNPIFSYGAKRFAKDAKASGAEGLIIVDLPPEEDSELCEHATREGLHWIRLATPTTDKTRLRFLLQNASGFLYYVSVAGITGGKSADEEELHSAIEKIRRETDLPIMIGFGIKSPDQVRRACRIGDGAVVGSALIDVIEQHLKTGDTKEDLFAGAVWDFVGDLAEGTAKEET